MGFFFFRSRKRDRGAYTHRGMRRRIEACVDGHARTSANALGHEAIYIGALVENRKKMGGG
jgi:hypothetical protein